MAHIHKGLISVETDVILSGKAFVFALVDFSNKETEREKAKIKRVTVIVHVKASFEGKETKKSVIRLT